MAYTKTPTGDTYQTKPVPFLSTWETREKTNTKDVYSQNVVWEQVKDQSGDYYEAIKRDGTSVFITLDGGVAGNITGMHWWDFNNCLCVTTSANRFLTFDETGTPMGNVATTFLASGPVGFTEFLYENGTQELVFGTAFGWNIAQSAFIVTPITDPDFPSFPGRYPVFLDGYLFALAGTSAGIANSALNDPFTWAAADVIQTEAYPDQLSAIARLGQYIVAFGVDTIQFFYDAANPTGTPLAAQTTVLNIGFKGGLTQHKDSLYFIGSTNNGPYSAFKLTGLQIEEITSYPLSRLLDSSEGSAGIGFTAIGNGMIVTWNGHPHYVVWSVLNAGSPYPGTAMNLPALNLDTQTWSWITWQNNGIFGNIGIFSSVKMAGNDVSSTGRTVFSHFSASGTHRTIYRINPSVYMDNGVVYPVIFRTQNLDYGTRRIKFGSRLLVNSDQVPTPSSNMTIRYTTDDYQTYSSTRSVDLAQNYPNLPALGQFRKIAFEFTYTDNFPMRWGQCEIDYNLGSQ